MSALKVGRDGADLTVLRPFSRLQGGNLEINFGPAGDGTLPTSMTMPLLATGRWLDVNGEAIYGTRGFPWGSSKAECTADRANASRVDKCFTFSGTTVFIIYLRWPGVPDGGGGGGGGDGGDGRVIHAALVKPTAATTVTLLGHPGTELKHAETSDGFRISVPAMAPDELGCELDLCHAFVFKVTAVAL